MCSASKQQDLPPTHRMMAVEALRTYVRITEQLLASHHDLPGPIPLVCHRRSVHVRCSMKFQLTCFPVISLDDTYIEISRGPSRIPRYVQTSAELSRSSIPT